MNVTKADDGALALAGMSNESYGALALAGMGNESFQMTHLVPTKVPAKDGAPCLTGFIS